MKMWILFLSLLFPGNWTGPASAAEIWRESATGLEFVALAGGCFSMGQADVEREKLALLKGTVGADLAFGDELPAHEVCLAGFYMGRYEITVGDFARFVEATGYRTEAEEQGGCQEYPIPRYRWQENSERNWRSPGFRQKDNEPVVCVSWNDARAFADWLSAKTPGRQFRLATEAEWEFAARDRGRIKDFDVDTSLDQMGWYVKNSPRRTSPVGGLQSGESGIHDLQGNVWEWVGDYYGWKYYTRPEKDNPKGPDHGLFRVIRGGGWNSFAWNCRAAKRDRALASHRDTNLGFRLVFTSEK
jgi:formylglycine-generating enzyme required for sulfatase activity